MDNNNNSSGLNVDNSYDDVDFNNKDPLFFSSGNEYMYRAEEDEEEYQYEEEEDGGGGANNKKKKKKSEFLIDGFDENSESLVRFGSGETGKFGTKIIIFIGIITLTVTFISILLFFYAKDHHTPLVNYIKPAPVIVISLDGFRYDYLNRGITPNLEALINDGSYRAELTVPQFPSKTFPNHYTIATGLYPESHGLISNHMFDPSTNKTFNVVPDSNNPVWYWGEPIWITAMNHGLKSACYFWPACSAKIKNQYPTYNIIPFSEKTLTKTKFDQIYDWIQLNDTEKPYLTMAYFLEVDTAGHRYGPDSLEVIDAIKLLDTSIGSFIDRLKSSNQYNTTNLIILSDHGMTSLSPDRVICLDEISGDKFFSKSCNIPDPTPLLSIFPIDGGKTINELYLELNNKHPNLTMYKKEDMPSILHFDSTKNTRIPPLLGIADLGWTVVKDCSASDNYLEKGNHGFNPEYSDMKSIFIAHGPNIKSSSITLPPSDKTTNITSFQNTEIYNFIATLLNIETPAANNGTTLLSDNFYIKQLQSSK